MTMADLVLIPPEVRLDAMYPLPDEDTSQEESARSDEARRKADAPESGSLPDEASPQPGAAPMGNTSQGPEWRDVVETLKLHRGRLLRISGVTAVDAGFRIVEKENKRFVNELALRVHVVRKIHHKDKAFKDRPEDLIPETLLSPSGRPIPTDVVTANYKLTSELPRRQAMLERPLLRKDVNRRKRLDPLVGGISIGSPQSPAGTLGALVWDKEDGSICILSNWHVLAGDLNAEVGNPCFQPSLFDQGRSTDVVAHLKRWSFNRQTDAAIAQLNGSRHYSTGEILDMFQTIKDVAEQVHLGMRVHKSSRSSDHSWGFIDGLYFSTAIAYSNGLVRVFEEQIHIAPLEDRPISEPGDSGAVWVTNAPNEGYLAVGLHFAGDLPHSSFGEYALANPMSVVARRLNFSFRPLFLEIRDDNVIPPPALVPHQPNGVGGPARFVTGGTLTGSGGQPFSNPIDPGGSG